MICFQQENTYIYRTQRSSSVMDTGIYWKRRWKNESILIIIFALSQAVQGCKNCVWFIFEHFFYHHCFKGITLDVTHKMRMTILELLDHWLIMLANSMEYQQSERFELAPRGRFSSIIHRFQDVLYFHT